MNVERNQISHLVSPERLRNAYRGTNKHPNRNEKFIEQDIMSPEPKNVVTTKPSNESFAPKEESENNNKEETRHNSRNRPTRQELNEGEYSINQFLSLNKSPKEHFPISFRKNPESSLKRRKNRHNYSLDEDLINDQLARVDFSQGKYLDVSQILNQQTPEYKDFKRRYAQALENQVTNKGIN